MDENTTEMIAETADDQQAVVFRLAGEAYSIEIFRVSEIIRVPEITPIPRTLGHVKGLVNLRGKTIPVVDLRTRLDLPETEDTDSTRIIVVESEEGNIGLKVDAVTEVMTLHGDSMENAPEMVAETKTAEYVRSIAKHSSQLITMLDLESALAA